ncbi:dynein axonemal assembly factor 8 isoform X2 [Perognathus longimembris pacificus]|nr:dynein axonemal assembly factor 8 isoform X2 [Perognathus longimembris pacificus]XP_048188193.1 dynein axonemal assembly factor 8 isoform X2 [Perognathus longimembris pacificus]
MEFRDKDVPSLGSPWDAILKAAKDQLPSLDSDSSLSEDREEEEEPYIFQRNQPILIPDLAEELAEDPADASEPGTWGPAVKRSPSEPVLVPGGLFTEPRSGQRMRDSALREGSSPGQPFQGCADTNTLLRMAETSSWLEGDLGNLSFDTKASQGPACGPQGEATLPPEGKAKAEPWDEDAWRDSAKRRALRLERRKMIEKEVLQKVTWGTRDPPCSSQGQAEEPEPRPQASSAEPQEGHLVLSLQHLEDWDLDDILKSLPVREDSPTDGTSRNAWWLAKSCQGQGNYMPRSQGRLQEQLALLCATQSKTYTSAQKMTADIPQDTEEQETGSRCAMMRLQSEPCQRLDGGRRLNTEPPTIFMDLRPTKPWDPESQESSESSQYSSSDSEEEEEETTAVGEQRDQARQTLPSSQGPWDCTAKSWLLQQLKAFRKGVAPPELPVNEGSSSQKTQAPEEVIGVEMEKEGHTEPQADELSAQSRLPDRCPMASGSREVLEPALGQL